MAEHSTELRNGRKRTTVKLKCGETVKLCRCFQSKEFPFCDETHKTLDSDAGPVIVQVLKQEDSQ
ncbi:MAG: CDGSH iron-sulfur domain-containing protein [Chloroflexota bacterium]